MYAALSGWTFRDVFVVGVANRLGPVIVSMRTMLSAIPSNLDATRGLTSSIDAAANFQRACNREAGNEGSNGRQALPDLWIARIATIAQGDLSKQNATGTSGPAPKWVKVAAN